MEKLRRKRINSSLDQLRTLLPYSVNMKKDMASLLEQTVEYINIVHTILNEDKPACLGKVYHAYRQKTEEIENFRKSLKKLKKQRLESGCSWNRPIFPLYNDVGAVRSFQQNMPWSGQPPRGNTWPQQDSFEPYSQTQQGFSALPASASLYNPPSVAFHHEQPTHSTACNNPMEYHQENGSRDEHQLHDHHHADHQLHNHHRNDNQFHNHEVNHEDNYHDNHHNDKFSEEQKQVIENDECCSTVASTATSPSQASTDETSMSGSQNYNSDIATAAIATGILRHSPKREASSNEGIFEQHHEEDVPFDPSESWIMPCSLPPLSLGQPNFVTCEESSSSSTPSLYSHGKFTLSSFLAPQ